MRAQVNEDFVQPAMGRPAEEQHDSQRTEGETLEDHFILSANANGANMDNQFCDELGG